MSEIVVGYDGSDTAKRALEEAAGLAKALGDKIVIVFGFAPGGYGGGEVPAQRDAVKEIGEKITKEGVDSLASAGVESEVEMVNAKGAHALNEVADRRDARMIVIGSHGDSPLKGAVIGSTPYGLVHVASKPVLVVH